MTDMGIHRESLADAHEARSMSAAQILDSIKPGTSTALAASTDTAVLQRVARNLAAHVAGQLTVTEAAGIFSVNVEELLDIIARLSAPATDHPVWVKTCQHPGCVITSDHGHGRHATPAARDWEAEAEEFKQYAADVAADEADQRRWDRGNR